MKYIIPTWATWETVDTIASRFGTTPDHIMNANPILCSIPVYPGMVLEIPGQRRMVAPSNGCLEYVVQPDDNLFNISGRFKLDYNRLIAQNPHIENPGLVWPGQVIYLVYADY